MDTHTISPNITIQECDMVGTRYSGDNIGHKDCKSPPKSKLVVNTTLSSSMESTKCREKFVTKNIKNAKNFMETIDDSSIDLSGVERKRLKIDTLFSGDIFGCYYLQNWYFLFFKFSKKGTRNWSQKAHRKFTDTIHIQFRFNPVKPMFINFLQIFSSYSYPTKGYFLFFDNHKKGHIVARNHDT